MSKMPFILRTTAMAAVCSLPMVNAYASEIDADDLLSLSLEQLTNIEVTSVSKKSEKVTEAPAAIYVITSDDIRRLGATSIPEALRVVPGLNVAQSGSHQWAVTARGFNDQFANKLLVLIDGRSIYTPLFNGVFWDVQDTPLEDIDRIEVIRGPGATLWGANAVNGVINIITKHTKDTVGSFVSATTGSHINAITTARHGVKVGDDSYVRAYVKHKNIDEYETMTGVGADDQWRMTQVGFRGDLTLNDKQNLTVQGDAYHANLDNDRFLPVLTAPYVNPINDTNKVRGGNVLARWNYTQSADSAFTVQSYIDTFRVDSAHYKDTIDTFDAEFQHDWSGWERQEWSWGMGYRLVQEDLDPTLYYNLTPDSRSDNLFSAFLQDKIALVPESLFLTLGTKVEHNEYSGVEWQPSARLAWIINENQTFWTSVSRAVKTPYRNTDDGSLVLGVFPTTGVPAGFIGSLGNPSLESERLVAYEAGYRIQPVPTVSVDTAVFYNDYSNLTRGILGTTTTRTVPGFGTTVFFPILPQNDNEARSYGVEVATNWEVLENWQLGANYSYLDLKFDKPDPLGFPLEGKSPQQQFNVRSTVLLQHGLEMNNTLYYVDELSGISINDYFRFDTRIAWQALDNVELSIVGQNLFDSEHPEFSGFLYQTGSQVPRTVFGNITFRF